MAIAPFHADAPATLDELTDRVIACKKIMDFVNPTLLRLTEGETVIGEEIRSRLSDGSETRQRVLTKSSKCLRIPLPCGIFLLEFEKSPVIVPGETQKLTLSLADCPYDNLVFEVIWHLPDGWSFAEGASQRIMAYTGSCRGLSVSLTAGEFSGSLEHLLLEFRLSGRCAPMYGVATFQRAGSLSVTDHAEPWQEYWDRNNRKFARR